MGSPFSTTVQQLPYSINNDCLIGIANSSLNTIMVRKKEICLDIELALCFTAQPGFRAPSLNLIVIIVLLFEKQDNPIFFVRFNVVCSVLCTVLS